jgi:hypothetical protein
MQKEFEKWLTEETHYQHHNLKKTTGNWQYKDADVDMLWVTYKSGFLTGQDKLIDYINSQF